MLKSALRAYWNWTTGGARWHVVDGIGAPVVFLLALIVMGDDETRRSLQLLVGRHDVEPEAPAHMTSE